MGIVKKIAQKVKEKQQEINNTSNNINLPTKTVNREADAVTSVENQFKNFLTSKLKLKVKEDREILPTSNNVQNAFSNLQFANTNEYNSNNIRKNMAERLAQNSKSNPNLPTRTFGYNISNDSSKLASTAIQSVPLALYNTLEGMSVSQGREFGEHPNQVEPKYIPDREGKMVENVNPMKAWRDRINEKIQSNRENMKSDVGKYFNDLTPSLVQNAISIGLNLISPTASMVQFSSSAMGGYYDEAIEKGMSKESARKYGLVMAGLESATEGIINRNIANGAVKIATGGKVGEAISENFISAGIENFLQEAIMEPAGDVTESWAKGDKIKLKDDVMERSLKSGVSGLVSSMILGGATTGLAKCANTVNKMQNNEKVTENDINDCLKELNENGMDVSGNISETIKGIYNQGQAGDITQNNTSTKEMLLGQLEERYSENNENKGIANDSLAVYNNTESEVYNNGKIQSGTMGEISKDISSGLQQNSKQQQTEKYTAEEYRKFEQSIKPIEDTKLTDEQKIIKDKYQRQYNKDIVFFDGKNNNGYLGGASLVNKNKIYIDTKSVETFGIDKITNHEILESDIRHNKELSNDIIQPAIQAIIEDSNFEKQKAIFWNNQEGNIPSDYLIAKDILCDRYSELKTGEKLDYENILSKETGMTIDFALDNFHKQLYKTNIKESANNISVKTESVVNPSSNNIISQKEENNNNKRYKSKSERYLSRAERSFIEGISNRLDISKNANKEILNDTVSKIKEEINKNGKLSEQRKNELFEEVYSDLKKIDSEYYEQYKDLNKELAQAQLFVSDKLRNSITDYNDFRRNSKIKLSTKEGMDIDTYYKQLSEIYPELFQDNIVNEHDQLNQIIQVAEDIQKTERNLQDYDDINFGGQLKQYAKEEFDRLVNNLSGDINKVDRYNKDREAIKQRKNYKLDDVKEAYNNIKKLQRSAEKVVSRELLTERDNAQVDRLLKNEITIDELPKNVNRSGIINVYNAKKPLFDAQKQINKYKKDVRNKYDSLAKEMIDDIVTWKDKKKPIWYNRETAQRNIRDIVPNKATADKINKTYFDEYTKNEAEATRRKNETVNKIKELNIDTKKKYSYQGQKISEAELAQLFLEKKLSQDSLNVYHADVEKIKKIANTYKEILDDYFTDMSEALIRNGYNPVEYRADYFPHFIDNKPDGILQKVASKIGIDLTKKRLPTEIAGMTDTFKPGKTWNGHLLERKTDVTDLDAMKALDNYINGATDIIYHTDDIQRLRALDRNVRASYSDEGTKAKINEILDNEMYTDEERDTLIDRQLDKPRDQLSNFATWLLNYTNTVAGKKSKGDRAWEDALGREMYSTMNSIESKIAGNTIAGNISVATTNFAPLFQAMGQMKVGNVVNGIFDTMINAVTNKDTIVQDSDFITNRRGTEKLKVKTIDKVGNVLSKPMELIDGIVSESIVRGKYRENLNNGMTSEVALQEADKFAGNLMADRSKGALPLVFNSKNPIAKLATMFQVEVNNSISNYTKDMKLDAKTKTQLVANYTKLAVASYVFNSMLMGLRGGSEVIPDPLRWADEILKMIFSDDDKEKDKAKEDLIDGILGAIPFASNVAGIMGKNDIGRIPISAGLVDVTKLPELVNKDNSKEYKQQIAKDEVIKPLTFLLAPFGSAQAWKTGEAINVMQKGEKTKYDKEGNELLKYPVEDKSAYNTGKAILFGNSARSEYKEYANNGYKGLNAKQTQLYRQSKIPYKELLDYINTKFESDKDENGDPIPNSLRNKKIDYIESMDITDKQKNDMYKYDIFSDSQIEKAQEIKAKGGNEEDYYKYLRNTILYESEKDKNGDTVNGSKKAKQLEWILNSDLSSKSKDTIINKEFSSETAEDNLNNYKNIDANYNTLLYYNQLGKEGKEQYREIASKGVDQTKYIKYKQKVKEATKAGKETETDEDNVGMSEKCGMLYNSSLSKKDKALVYELEIGKKDEVYQYLKKTNININEYLKYKQQEFESDKEDNGTTKGKTVSGSKKAKVYAYINSMNITYEQRLLLLGSQYKLNNAERTKVANYINKMKLSKSDKLKYYEKMKGFTVYKDGRVTW